jgi:hypothetical protein
MVEIEAGLSSLMLEVQGLHKLWALRSRLEIPLEHIRRAYADPNPAMGWFQGLKVAGTDIPHVFRAGLFYQEGGSVFWDVRHPEKTIVIELEDERFTRLIVEVADPNAELAKIEQALGPHREARTAAEREVDALLHVDESESEVVRQQNQSASS